MWTCASRHCLAARANADLKLNWQPISFIFQNVSIIFLHDQCLGKEEQPHSTLPPASCWIAGTGFSGLKTSPLHPTPTAVYQNGSTDQTHFVFMVFSLGYTWSPTRWKLLSTWNIKSWWGQPQSFALVLPFGLFGTECVSLWFAMMSQTVVWQSLALAIFPNLLLFDIIKLTVTKNVTVGVNLIS